MAETVAVALRHEHLHLHLHFVPISPLEREIRERENNLSVVSKKMTLACRIEGQGPELIMFHGGTGSWTHWIRNIPALRDHFTVHAYDLPGNGDSPSVPEISRRTITSISFASRFVMLAVRPSRYFCAGFRSAAWSRRC